MNTAAATARASPADEPAPPPCTVPNGCLTSPAIQSISNLPGGTSEPNTLITQAAVTRTTWRPG